MKLRINRDLHDRARACSYAIGASLTEFTRLALKKYMRGDLDGVAIPLEWLSATSNNSAVISLAGILEHPHVVRIAIASGVIFAESRTPKPFRTDLREGVDYIVGAPPCR